MRRCDERHRCDDVDDSGFVVGTEGNYLVSKDELAHERSNGGRDRDGGSVVPAEYRDFAIERSHANPRTVVLDLAIHDNCRRCARQTGKGDIAENILAVVAVEDAGFDAHGCGSAYGSPSDKGKYVDCIELCGSVNARMSHAFVVRDAERVTPLCEAVQNPPPGEAERRHEFLPKKIIMSRTCDAIYWCHDARYAGVLNYVW